jgi:hypothetical protein
MTAIGALWRAVEAALAPSPAVAAALRPPITDFDLERWTARVGPLPVSLRELYAGHEGTEHADGGGAAFCFVGNWYPLPVDRALASYELLRRMTDVWGMAPLIPFAVDSTGCRLGMPTDGSEAVHIMFLDTPPGLYFPTLEALMSATAEGLRDDTEATYRVELTDRYLRWVNREIEAADLDR